MRRMPDQMPVWSADNRKHETGSGDFREVDSDLSKGISGQQTQTGREGSFYKTDSEEGDRKF